MITLAVLLVFIGSYTFYFTSKKANLPANAPLYKWIQKNKNLAKGSSIVCFLTALGLGEHVFGLSGGIIYFLWTLMLVLSLIVLIAPLNFWNWKYTTVLFIILMLLETLL